MNRWYVWHSGAWMSRGIVLLTLVLSAACDDDSTVTVVWKQGGRACLVRFG